MDFLARLRRFEEDGVAVYIDPAHPGWFVPSSRADRLLALLCRYGDRDAAAIAFCAGEQQGDLDQALRDSDRLLRLLDGPPPAPYRGRAATLRLNRLKEVWFHLTDTCNLSCRHCLFSSSPGRTAALAPAELGRALAEARHAGCRLFYFTGGEPFVYPDLPAHIGRILEADPGAHVVVLTNGLLLRKHLPQLLALDRERLHLQVSLDGLRQAHDHLRGRGSFDRLQENLAAARAGGLAFTVSVAANAGNAKQLPEIARLAAEAGASGLHLMFHFIRGKGSEQQFVAPDALFPHLRETAAVCRRLGLVLDNLEVLRSQIFTMPATRHDQSNMAWESLAVGPDGMIYPSPALVGVSDLACGHLDQGLEQVWRTSAVLEQIRASSLADIEGWWDDPFSFLTGGGDPDHSFVASGSLVGRDPYLPLYNRLVLWLISEQARRYPDQGLFRLRMGDLLHDCALPEEDGSAVRLTHCNCVLSLADRDARNLVREFYGGAARRTNIDIVNPFAPTDDAGFVPEQSVSRSYGCGSPVRDAAPRAGETLVDLGSGSGVECFLAAAEVGAAGRVIGVDMTEAMLELAESSRRQVVQELGYDNLEFRRGFLEAIPLADGTADVVISNCVINLSPDKRQTYLEIFRILRPGGRMVIADIVTDGRVDAAIRNSGRFRGECLGGAMRQQDLVQMLADCGFTSLFIHRRLPYRQVGGHRFFSLTYEARRPEQAGAAGTVRAMYRGPHQGMVTESGVRLERGQVVRIASGEAARCEESVFLLDEAGVVTNVEQGSGCCGRPPEAAEETGRERSRVVPIRRHRQGCMVCGEELVYDNEPRERRCHFCGSSGRVSVVCRQGHYICDQCHQEEALAVIRHICTTSREEDMIQLLTTIRSHPAVPMHGPEHHAMVPGIILAAFRNGGGAIGSETIATGIERGAGVPGGACGFWGSCGAAVGAGIAAALILDATPLTPHPRQQAQAFVAAILGRVAEIRGGRCCQRETWLALQATARLSGQYLGRTLRAGEILRCSQYRENKECIRGQCPLWNNRSRQATTGLTFLNMAK
ncbi:DUF5714 domain-containing protein [Thermodesulfobacteriota bacterium B35]